MSKREGEGAQPQCFRNLSRRQLQLLVRLPVRLHVAFSSPAKRLASMTSSKLKSVLSQYGLSSVVGAVIGATLGLAGACNEATEAGISLSAESARLNGGVGAL